MSVHACADGCRSQVFVDARSQNRWLDRSVGDALLHEVYELAKWGPTSMNCSPMRLRFLRTREAKERLLPALAPANVDKVRTAPVVALVAYDMRFHAHLPVLFPHRPGAGEIFECDERLRETTAFRNGTLQGAYLMVAARMLGLDCGPLSGFDADAVNRLFFADGDVRVNFICGLGFGDPAGLFPRLPRLPFDEACELL